MSREIDRDARDMLNRYNNKRRQLWDIIIKTYIFSFFI